MGRTITRERRSAATGSSWVIVPILGFFWLFWLARAIKTVTGKESAAGTFVLLLLLANLGAAIVQSGINKSLAR